MFRNLFGDLFNALFLTKRTILKYSWVCVPFLAMGRGNNPIWMDENTATVVNQNFFLLINEFFTYSAKSLMTCGQICLLFCFTMDNREVSAKHGFVCHWNTCLSPFFFVSADFCTKATINDQLVSFLPFSPVLVLTATDTMYGFELAAAVCPLMIRLSLVALQIGTLSSRAQWHLLFSSEHLQIFENLLIV